MGNGEWTSGNVNQEKNHGGLKDMESHGILKWTLAMLLLSVGYTETFSQPIPADRDALEQGSGAGVAMYADLNGYPGPKHILEMEHQLNLNLGQIRAIETVLDEMSEQARAKGKTIVKKEQELNALFRTGTAELEAVSRLATDIGRLRGELRAIHLTAHIHAKQILTDEQTRRYNELRHGKETPKHGVY